MGKDREDEYTVVMKRTMSECAVALCILCWDSIS